MYGYMTCGETILEGTSGLDYNLVLSIGNLTIPGGGLNTVRPGIIWWSISEGKRPSVLRCWWKIFLPLIEEFLIYARGALLGLTYMDHFEGRLLYLEALHFIFTILPIVTNSLC